MDALLELVEEEEAPRHEPLCANCACMASAEESHTRRTPLGMGCRDCICQQYVAAE